MKVLGNPEESEKPPSWHAECDSWPTGAEDCLFVPVFRLEFQHGIGLPVPQLASVRGGVCAAVCLSGRSSDFYAWEPPLLPGGKTGDLLFYLQTSIFFVFEKF